MAAEHLASIVRAFHQGDAALAIVMKGTGRRRAFRFAAGLVEMHGGSIALESKPAREHHGYHVRLPKQARLSAAASRIRRLTLPNAQMLLFS